MKIGKCSGASLAPEPWVWNNPPPSQQKCCLGDSGALLFQIIKMLQRQYRKSELPQVSVRHDCQPVRRGSCLACYANRAYYYIGMFNGIFNGIFCIFCGKEFRCLITFLPRAYHTLFMSAASLLDSSAPSLVGNVQLFHSSTYHCFYI